MSKFTKGARGIKKMFGSSGLKSLGDSLNMGKWATNIARGFGVQTRNKAPILSSKQVIDSSNRGNVTAAFGQLAGTGGAAQQMSPVTKTVNTLGERTLNSTGLGLQIGGNAAVYGGGIGTLGYMMKGDGTEAGVDEISAAFPVVISVVEKINEPRYPSFKGIMAAKKKTIEQKDLAAVGVAAQSAWSQVKDATPRPPREAGLKVNDEGSGGEALVTFLAEKKLI